jgi:hypothetical protein
MLRRRGEYRIYEDEMRKPKYSMIAPQHDDRVFEEESEEVKRLIQGLKQVQRIKNLTKNGLLDIGYGKSQEAVSLKRKIATDRVVRVTGLAITTRSDRKKGSVRYSV